MANQINQMSSSWLPAYGSPILRTTGYAEIWSGLGGKKLLGPIQLVAGTVTISRASAVRRTVSNLTFLPDRGGLLLPSTGGQGLLFPLGYEIALYKGCIYQNGTTEYAKLGRFLLGGSEVDDDGNGVKIVTTLGDRGATISRAKFTQPYATDGTSTLDVAIKTMLATQVPGLVFNFAPSTVVPPVSTFSTGADPWASAITLATGGGMELYADWNGTIVLQPTPDPGSIQPCTTYTEGTAAMATAIKRTLSNANVPNVIVATAQGSGVAPPLQTFWWDNDPSSKTFYAFGDPGPTLPPPDAGSTYPMLVASITSSIATDITSLQAVANQQGVLLKGKFETAVFTLRDQPAHDVDDVIGMQRTAAGIPLGTNYVLDQISIDLTAVGTTSIAGRLV